MLWIAAGLLMIGVVLFFVSLYVSDRMPDSINPKKDEQNILEKNPENS